MEHFASSVEFIRYLGCSSSSHRDTISISWKCIWNIDLLSFSVSKWRYFGWYLAFLSIFHFSEYIMVAIYRPNKISLDSFLLNQSPEYQIAAVASWIEFALELWLFPSDEEPFLYQLCRLGFNGYRRDAKKTCHDYSENQTLHTMCSLEKRGNMC